MTLDAGKPLTRAQLRDLCEFDIPQDPLWSLTNYHPPGPVAARYINSTGPIDLIMGPAGSGKSVASIFKPIKLIVGAFPICRDGVVRARHTVLRDNYRALYRTTLRTWFEFFPPDWAGSIFSGGQDRPAQHRLLLSTVRHWNGALREVPVDLLVDFFAVGDVAIEELLKGYETSTGYVDEGDLVHKRVIPFLFGRTGRYPPREMLEAGAIRPRMVCSAFNPPDIDHPAYQAGKQGTFNIKPVGMLEAPRAPGTEIAGAGEDGELAKVAVNFFEQPSGLSPDAENRAGKTFEEYQTEAMAYDAQDRRRFVEGKPGYAKDGKPVYEFEFDERLHVAPGALKPIPGLPLHIGFDQGGHPAAVLFQVDSLGKVRIYAEVAPGGGGVGIERFTSMLIPLLMSDRFKDLPPGKYAADPAGFYGADKVMGESHWAAAVGLALGRTLMPAPTNEIEMRLEAVRKALAFGLLIDFSCRVLIGGFAAHYKFRKVRDGVVDRYELVPHKNDYANPHDALQYGLLAVKGVFGVVVEAAKAGRPGNVTPITAGSRGANADFNVWNV